jgi:hypothetical protein
VPSFLLDEQETKPGDRAGLVPCRGFETDARPFGEASWGGGQWAELGSVGGRGGA